MHKHFNFVTTPAFPVPTNRYLADFLTDRAVDFIQRHRDRPFLLYVPHFGVHSPHEAKPELIARFRSRTAVGGHKNPTYAAMIASIDESVGRIMQTLNDLRLAESTVLIFASDNGGVGGYLREDIGETHNLATSQPDRARELHARLVAWRTQVGARMPTPHRAGEKPATPTQP
jgi:arylsulfatase A-like enzyme